MTFDDEADVDRSRRVDVDVCLSAVGKGMQTVIRSLKQALFDQRMWRDYIA